MAFAELACRESLHDTETCLRVMQDRLYHSGIRGVAARNALADANKVHNWRIHADFAQALIAKPDDSIGARRPESNWM